MWDGLTVRACFGNCCAVPLRRDGDGALLVRDEQRCVDLVLRRGGDGARLLSVAPWDSKSLTLRVNGVLYDVGPLSLRAGDDVRLCAPGAWDDEDGWAYRVEAGTALGAPSENSATESAWETFVRSRRERIAEVLAASKVRSG